MLRYDTNGLASSWKSEHGVHPMVSFNTSRPFASLFNEPPAPQPPSKVPSAIALAETLALVDSQQRLVDERRMPLSRAYQAEMFEDMGTSRH